MLTLKVIMLVSIDNPCFGKIMRGHRLKDTIFESLAVGNLLGNWRFQRYTRKKRQNTKIGLVSLTTPPLRHFINHWLVLPSKKKKKKKKKVLHWQLYQFACAFSWRCMVKPN